MTRLQKQKSPLKSSAIAAGLLGLAVAGPAPALAHDSGRYTMLETKDGVVRLDKQSGALSTCVNEDGGWTCTPLQDGEGETAEAPAPGNQEDMAKLRRENLRLKQRIADLEASKAPLTDDNQKLNLPSDEEVDEAISYMERMIRKFRGAMKRLRENDQEPPTEL